MSDDDYTYFQAGEDYQRIVQIDGVRTTFCRNRFEIISTPGNDIWEQQAVQALREWIKWRKEEQLRLAGGVSG